MVLIMSKRVKSWCLAIVTAGFFPAMAIAHCADGVPRSGLMRALEANALGDIRARLKRGANPNQRLSEAHVWNFHEGAPCSISALTLAAQSGGPGLWTHVEGVRLLLDAGARIDPRDSNVYQSMRGAAEVGDLAVAKLLFERGDQDSWRRWSREFFAAAYRGFVTRPPDAEQLELLDFLVAHMAADPSDAGRFELLLVNSSLEPVVQHLLARGVRPAPGALAFVAQAGRLDLLASFLAHGAWVNAPVPDQNGLSIGTALTEAATAGRERTVAALLNAAADPRAVDSRGSDPLMLAVSGPCDAGAMVSCAERLATVKLLIARGAPRDRSNSYRQTALDFARARQDHVDEFVAALATPLP